MTKWWDWKEWWEESANGRVSPWLSPELEKDPDFKKANLGCGTLVFNHEHGWTNVDQFGNGEHGVMEWSLCDLPLPFEDGEFDYLFMSNILEHIPDTAPGIDGELWFALTQELLRITKDGGYWEIHGPDPRNVVFTLQKGGHTRLVGPHTFEHLCLNIQQGSMITTQMNEKYALKRVDHEEFNWPTGYQFKFGQLTDWHARRYFGRRFGEIIARILGRPWQLRMVYQVIWK